MLNIIVNVIGAILIITPSFYIAYVPYVFKKVTKNE